MLYQLHNSGAALVSTNCLIESKGRICHLTSGRYDPLGPNVALFLCIQLVMYNKNSPLTHCGLAALCDKNITFHLDNFAEEFCA